MNDRFFQRRVLILPAVLALSVCALSACGGGAAMSVTGGAGTGSGSGAGSGADGGLNGYVSGGQQPVSGSHVTVYAVGVGAPAAALGQDVTNSHGRWHVDVACPDPSTPMYAVARGGNPGLATGTDNAALRMMAVLGPCGTMSENVNINEMSTVAAGYALRNFITTTTTTVDVAARPGNAAGLRAAMQLATRLVDVEPGTDGPALLASGNDHTRRKVHTLANSLAACVNTAGSGSPQCQALFDCTTPGASYNDQAGQSAACTAGSLTDVPTDSLQALLAIAGQPGTVSMAGIRAVGAQQALFHPGLTAVPNDWTLSLSYENIGLREPTGIAIDADGHIWIANYYDRVVKLARDGTALSPPGGFTGGGLHESFDLAVDGDGNVWVTNEEGKGGFNNNRGSVTKLAPDGSILSGTKGYAGGGIAFPMALAVDTLGNVWVANTGPTSISKLKADGTPLSPTGGYTGGGVAYPIGVAVAPDGTIWIANQAVSAVSALDPAGNPLSPLDGYTAPGLQVPQGIAVDAGGNVWISDYYGQSVVELTATGTPLSPAGGYTGGGLTRPAGLAVDGAGDIWVGNYAGKSITHLQGASGLTPGAPLSPATGFTSPSLLQPYGLAIDDAGDLWVTNFGNDTVTRFIGVATPVSNPVLGAPQRP